MVPSLDLPTRKKLKATLDVMTNVVVVLFAVVAIGVLVKNYLAPRANKTSIAITKGTVFPDIAGVDYRQSAQTLVLALNVDCRYCSRSVSFYNSLAEAQRVQNAGNVNIVAAFINKDSTLVKSYADEKQLMVQAIAGVDLDKLGVHMTPTLILVDSAGKVLDSWRGELQPDGEREVFAALNLAYRPKAGSTATAANVTKTADIFDEQKAQLSIGPEVERQDDPAHFVEVFDVNSRGDVYIAYDKVMYKYDSEGRQKDARPLPPDFRSPFCADDDGNIYAYTGRNLSVFSPELVKVRDVSLNDRLPPEAFTLKLALDRKRESIYIQSYALESLSQILYRLDLKSQQVVEVYRLPKPVRFNPTYTPGAFDFALGEKFLYISDIYGYKIYVYSIEQNSLVKTIDRPCDLRPIEQEDGQFHLRKMTIAGLGQGTGLHYYPPILHLNYTGKGNLLVWTSQRVASGRQVVDVYNEQLRHVGTDLKFMNPGRSNSIFLNGKVYVPDYGFGRPTSAYTGSPLEIPAVPLALKVFDASL
jgi:thioredoxin-related protein